MWVYSKRSQGRIYYFTLKLNDMLESLLTTFQKMDEQGKKELISRFINVMSADEKAYGALFYTLEQQEKRIRENHIPIATNNPS